MEETETGQVRALSGLNVLAGIWLIIAPFILSYNSTGNRWQEIIVGIIVGILALIRLADVNLSWPSWINALAGIWLIIAPWVVSGTTTAARWNEVILGIIVAILAISSGAATTQHHTHTHVPSHS